ncbi:Rha family transcriptional regulator [Paraburkholderia sp. J63]|uniref:Rha family transcriptional regulator n=1 Tax=Paraburkholderia sp. J63 TaxID=2805434 RepID=UPI002ABE8147|nr:Rha family transcriptional regulator [Paraburkholderia sp. J63]
MIDLPALPDPLLTVRDARPMADSRIVAKMFGKRHDNVIRDVRALISTDKTCRLNFEETYGEVRGPNGGARKRLFYLMTEEGFMLLVMGFTGAAALAMKLRFIHAFQEMRAVLDAQRATFAEQMRDWELRERESKQRGTVGAKACIQTGRRFVGIELDPVHFANACERISEAARQGMLFGHPDESGEQAPLGLE